MRSGQLRGGDHPRSGLLGAGPLDVERRGALVIAAVAPLRVLAGAPAGRGQVIRAGPRHAGEAVGDHAAGRTVPNAEPLALIGQCEAGLVIAATVGGAAGGHRSAPLLLATL